MAVQPGIEILNLINASERRTTARMQRLLREAGLDLAAMEARTLRFVAPIRDPIVNGGGGGATLPFGGVKQSGYGRENGHIGLEHFTKVKAVRLGG